MEGRALLVARAAEPEDLTRLFLERASAGDVDGVIALHQRDAVLVGSSGVPSTRFTSSGGRRAAAEVARRQPDGSWLWAIDNPNAVVDRRPRTK